MEISNDRARRIALHAQGFGRSRPARPGPRQVRDAVRRLGAVQIDAVNVLVRAQYLTLYSRLGPYPLRLLDELVYEHRHAFEYWGHAASILPVELHPLVRWQMDRYSGSKYWLAFVERLGRERPGYLDAVLAEVADRGPLTYTELTDPARRERDTGGTPSRHCSGTAGPTARPPWTASSTAGASPPPGGRTPSAGTTCPSG